MLKFYHQGLYVVFLSINESCFQNCCLFRSKGTIQGTGV